MIVSIADDYTFYTPGFALLYAAYDFMFRFAVHPDALLIADNLVLVQDRFDSDDNEVPKDKHNQGASSKSAMVEAAIQTKRYHGQDESGGHWFDTHPRDIARWVFLGARTDTRMRTRLRNNARLLTRGNKARVRFT